LKLAFGRGTAVVVAADVAGVRQVIFGLLLGCSATGCAQHVQQGVPENWVLSRGGCLGDAVYAGRVNQAYARLKCPARTSVRVLASPEPAAYSWPNGEVFVTRGLLDLLDGEELAAAISHEVGHLLSSDGRGGVLGLRGHQKGLGAEVRADEIGTNLLTTAGIRPETMAAMLSKVRDAARLQPSCRSEMDRRIELLRHSFPSIAR
jgi:predicted Zn-dependent protease